MFTKKCRFLKTYFRSIKCGLTLSILDRSEKFQKQNEYLTHLDNHGQDHALIPSNKFMGDLYNSDFRRKKKCDTLRFTEIVVIKLRVRKCCKSYFSMSSICNQEEIAILVIVLKYSCDFECLLSSSNILYYKETIADF